LMVRRVRARQRGRFASPGKVLGPARHCSAA
jgi:hypothetical protein